MTHKHAFEGVDRSLWDITRIDLSFSGIIFVMCGDFCEVLVPKASRSQIVMASIKEFHFWWHVETYRLTINMRTGVNGHVTCEKFGGHTLSKLLIALGEFRFQCVDEGYVQCPPSMIIKRVLTATNGQ